MARRFLSFRRVSEGRNVPAVKVYGPGMRFWHWSNAFLVVLLCVTGYFIGVPPPSILGDASASYVMGWIRFLHLAAARLPVDSRSR